MSYIEARPLSFDREADGSIFPLTAVGSSSKRIETAFSRALFNGKDRMMNTHIDAKEQGDKAAHTETIVANLERLAGCGFASEESVSLLWLQKWYQTGGSDRVALVRHWEFLKLLVLTGKLDV